MQLSVLLQTGKRSPDYLGDSQTAHSVGSTPRIQSPGPSGRGALVPPAGRPAAPMARHRHRGLLPTGFICAGFAFPGGGQGLSLKPVLYLPVCSQAPAPASCRGLSTPPGVEGSWPAKALVFTECRALRTRRTSCAVSSIHGEGGADTGRPQTGFVAGSRAPPRSEHRNSASQNLLAGGGPCLQLPTHTSVKRKKAKCGATRYACISITT